MNEFPKKKWRLDRVGPGDRPTQRSCLLPGKGQIVVAGSYERRMKKRAARRSERGDGFSWRPMCRRRRSVKELVARPMQVGRLDLRSNNAGVENEPTRLLEQARGKPSIGVWKYNVEGGVG